MANPRFGFIGAGRMATALARGFIAAKLATSERILASDPYPAAGEQFVARPVAGWPRIIAKCWPDGRDLPRRQASEYGRGAGGLARPGDREHLLISIAAGVPLADVAAGLGDAPGWCAFMPNTPCLVGAGASGYCLGPNATGDDARWSGNCCRRGNGAPGGRIPAGRRDRPVRLRAGVRLRDDRGAQRRRGEDGAAARRGRWHWRRRPSAAPPEWFSRPTSIPANSKMQLPAPAARRSPAWPHSRRPAVRAAMIAAVEAATRRYARSWGPCQKTRACDTIAVELTVSARDPRFAFGKLPWMGTG